MRKPKLLIIVLFQNLGETRAFYAKAPAPPLSGMLVAALTPPIVDLELLHEMIRPIDYTTDADFVALSFLDNTSQHAFDVAARFRALGKTVIAGGRYASTFPEEVIPHFDVTVVGEAEPVWAQVVEDLVAGRAKRVYRAPFAPPLTNIPPPRYDLAEAEFVTPVVTEATRGCPFRCSYCQLNIQPAAFRTRPIDDVLRDLTATERLPWRKRQMAMLYDNNLCGEPRYAKDLLREIAKLKLWGLGVQFSLNALQDHEYMDLLEAAHCRMAFLGMESLNEPSLLAVNKKHNRVAQYGKLFDELKRRGILIFAGTMLALDEDTPEYYDNLPQELERIDPSAIFLSIAIPIPGTPLQQQMQAEGRIFDTNLRHYDGDHLVFHPRSVTAAEVREAFLRVNQTFYSWASIARRWGRLMRAYLGSRHFLRRLVPAALTSFILLRLSLYQRGHLRDRVLPLVDEIAEPERRAAEAAG
jgi:radical SAM superfamily enzyme YgiQ (UPF0313 family)